MFFLIAKTGDFLTLWSGVHFRDPTFNLLCTFSPLDSFLFLHLLLLLAAYFCFSSLCSLF